MGAVRCRLIGLVFASLLAGVSLASAQERTLIIGTKEAEPFVLRSPSGALRGISVDLWRSVAADLELEYEYRELELDELLAGLADGSVDVGVAALTVTGARERRFDFTHAYYSSGLRIAIASQPSEGMLGVLARVEFSAFLKALAALFAVVWIAGALVWLFERRRNPEQFGGGLIRGMGEAFWWSAVTMTTVGYGDRAPKTVGGRLFALIWMFTGVILISGFTATIASTLTVGQLQTDITGPRDLNRYVIGTVPGTTSEAWLERHSVRTLSFQNVRAGLEAVAGGELKAVVYDAPILRYLAAREFEGRIDVLSHLLEPQAYAFGVPTESPLRERINRSVLRHTEDDAWAILLSDYLADTE
jgi:ABC-type amino acid transport substrate-binding protein